MKDILLNNANDDLLIENGDFVIGDSDKQNVKLIVDSFKGEFKEFPLVGFGAIGYVKTNTSEMKFKRDLKIQLENDNYLNPKIDVSEGFEKLKIEI